jgi:hypothetical protein
MLSLSSSAVSSCEKGCWRRPSQCAPENWGDLRNARKTMTKGALAIILMFDKIARASGLTSEWFVLV